MSSLRFGFYFSANADKSANDYTLYCESAEGNLAKMAIRYKNAPPNSLYELWLDPSDMRALSVQLKNMADRLDPAEDGFSELFEVK